MEFKETDLNFLGGGNRIRRACKGFHFVGDFFDRYWTCHAFEYQPKNDARPKIWPEDKQAEKGKGEKEKRDEMRRSFGKLIDIENSFGSVPDKNHGTNVKYWSFFCFTDCLRTLRGVIRSC
jgi:hypothetical protein